MNRDAAGLGSWLLRGTARPVSASAQELLLDAEAFLHWQAETHCGETNGSREALLALLREIWREELTREERRALQGIHLGGKTEAAMARELGVHHSSVGRLRRRGEAKLRLGLGYAMRYQALVEQLKHR